VVLEAGDGYLYGTNRTLHRSAVLTGRAQIIEGLLTVVVAAIAWVRFYPTPLRDYDASFR
jgi:hypothetical protein